MPGHRTKADQRIERAGLIEFEVDPGAGKHDPAFVDVGFHLGIGRCQRALHRRYATIGQPVQIEARTGNFLVLEIGQLVPGKTGAQIVATIGDARQKFLVELLFKDIGQIGNLLVDVLRIFQADGWIHGSKGQHDLEGMQRQV